MTKTTFTLLVDFEVWKAIQNKRPVESFTENDVLRQMLGLPAREQPAESSALASSEPLRQTRQHIRNLDGESAALDRIKAHLESPSLRRVSRMRSAFASPDDSMRVVLIFSKYYHGNASLWYSVYSHQMAFMATNDCYLALFAKEGNEGFVIPAGELREWHDDLPESKNSSHYGPYRHIIIYQSGGDFYIRTKGGLDDICITDYMVGGKTSPAIAQVNIPPKTEPEIAYSRRRPPEIIYLDDSGDKRINEAQCKYAIIAAGVATVRIYYADGDIANKRWHITQFGEDSSLSGNLKTGYLRYWRERGIVKAEVFAGNAE